jgi:predicted DNA-binding ribbon-helix-helix protein
VPVLRKRSSLTGGEITSVSLEDDFWDGIREIAKRQKITVSALAETINQDYDQTDLLFAIRVYAFKDFCLHLNDQNPLQ